MGLGPDFTDIIKKHNLNDLPNDWLSLDLNDLIQPAKAHLELQQALRQHNKDYKAHFASTANSTDDHTKSTNPTTTTRPTNPRDQERQDRIRSAIANNTFRPEDFAKDVRPNCCVWHNTAHLSAMCHVLKNLTRKASTLDPPTNIDTRSTTSVSKLTTPTAPVHTPSRLQQHQPKAQQVFPPPVPQTINTTHDITGHQTNPQDLFPDADEVSTLIHSVNDTDNNKSDSPRYFSSLNCSSSLSSQNIPLPHINFQLPRFILDSGAYPSMVSDKAMFLHLSSLPSTVPSTVTLADNVTQIPIHGIGTIRIRINNAYVLELHNVLYVPTLHNNLYYIPKLLISCTRQYCYFNLSTIYHYC